MDEKILVVEGERKFRELYQTGLKDAGYKVEIAADAQHALKKLEREPVDLIVTDLVLPDGAGFALLQSFLKVTNKTKVVINTSYVEYKSDFQSWVADAYLTKSSDISELKNTIDGGGRVDPDGRSCSRAKSMGLTPPTRLKKTMTFQSSILPPTLIKTHSSVQKSLNLSVTY